MINYQTITIDLQPDYREPVVQMYLSERDVGRPIQVNVLMQGQPYSFTAGTTVHIDLRKPSGHVVQVNGNYAVGSNVVLFNVVEQMAAEPGMCLTELSIIGDGQDPIGSKNWLTKVELSPMHAGDPSETWIEDLDELVQDAMEGHIDATLSIPGDAADAAAVGEELADLKSAIDACFIFGTTVYVQITNDSASVTEYKENGNRGYIGNTGNFTASATYATFLYNVIADGYVWFDATTGNKSLAVFRTNQIGSANFIARYRTNDGNLPDAEHKLAVTAGQMLAIGVSVSASTEVYNTFILNVPEIDNTIKLTNDVNFNTAQEGGIARIAAEIKRQTGTIVKSGSDYIITNRNARYTIRRFDRADIREYVWRIYKGEISDGAGNWVKLWESSDTDGVIRISGEDDFIGGYHGDETETSFAIYIDGVLKAGESVDMPYQTIEIYQESDVYHCDTSPTPNVVAFKRNKILRFDADGCHVCNYWTAQENLDLQYIYPGMLSVNRYVSGTSGTYLLTGYHTDGNYKYMDADTGLDADHAVAKVIMSTLYGYAEIDTHYITDDPAFATSITDYDTESSQRLKVYSGLRNVQMAAGDSVRAEATIII